VSLIVHSVRINRAFPLWTPLGPRWWRNGADLGIEAICNDGVRRWDVNEGFCCDFRSGGWGVDPVVPWCDDVGQLVTWVIHDLNCYGLTSWSIGNALMLQMGAMSSMGPVKARIAYLGVQPFKKRAWNTFGEWDSLEPKFQANKGKFRYSHNARAMLPLHCQILPQKKKP